MSDRQLDPGSGDPATRVPAWRIFATGFAGIAALNAVVALRSLDALREVRAAKIEDGWLPAIYAPPIALLAASVLYLAALALLITWFARSTPSARRLGLFTALFAVGYGFLPHPNAFQPVLAGAPEWVMAHGARFTWRAAWLLSSLVDVSLFVPAWAIAGALLLRFVSRFPEPPAQVASGTAERAWLHTTILLGATALGWALTPGPGWSGVLATGMTLALLGAVASGLLHRRMHVAVDGRDLRARRWAVLMAVGIGALLLLFGWERTRNLSVGLAGCALPLVVLTIVLPRALVVAPRAVYWLPRGAIDAQKLFRRTTVYGALTVVMIFAFGIVEHLLSQYMGSWLPDETSPAVAAGSLSLLVHPLKQRLEQGVDALLRRGLRIAA